MNTRKNNQKLKWKIKLNDKTCKQTWWVIYIDFVNYLL